MNEVVELLYNHCAFESRYRYGWPSGDAVVKDHVRMIFFNISIVAEHED